jgi:hypothetical protein
MKASAPAEVTESLVAELHRLGVRHLARLAPAAATGMPPADLLRALAEHPEARLRAALILVFLRRPEFAHLVPSVVAAMPETPPYTLKLYYQAAVYLQGELAPVLRDKVPGWEPLPDRFSGEFGLPAAGVVSTDEGLQALGEVHQRLSGRAYDWAGSYRQHVGLFVRQLGAADGPRHN